MAQPKNRQNKIIQYTTKRLLSNRWAVLLLDPFIPRLLSFYLSRSLKKWRKQRILENYEVKVQRVSRLCYEVNLHVLAKKSETQKVITQYIQRTFKSLMDF